MYKKKSLKTLSSAAFLLWGVLLLSIFVFKTVPSQNGAHSVSAFPFGAVAHAQDGGDGSGGSGDGSGSAGDSGGSSGSDGSSGAGDSGGSSGADGSSGAAGGDCGCGDAGSSSAGDSGSAAGGGDVGGNGGGDSVIPVLTPGSSETVNNTNNTNNTNIHNTTNNTTNNNTNINNTTNNTSNTTNNTSNSVVYGGTSVSTQTQNFFANLPYYFYPKQNYYTTQPSVACSLTVSPPRVAAGQPVVLSWSNPYETPGHLTGVGNVPSSGSMTLTLGQSATYSATFGGPNGQTALCSVVVLVGTRVLALANTPAPYVTLSAVPYTGLDLGPVGTTMYWLFLGLWCLIAAYLVAVKRVQNTLAGWLSATLYGTAPAANEPVHEPASAAHTHNSVASIDEAVVSNDEGIDDFIYEQIHHRQLQA